MGWVGLAMITMVGIGLSDGYRVAIKACVGGDIVERSSCYGSSLCYRGASPSVFMFYIFATVAKKSDAF